MHTPLLILLLIATPVVKSSPALQPVPLGSGHRTPIRVARAEHPLITPSPSQWDPTKTLKSRRGVISDLAGDVGSVLAGLGSDIPSYVASGIPNFFQDFPTADKVQSSLGLDDSQIAALPTQVLNIPYASPPSGATDLLTQRTEAMETGPIRAGTYASTAMFSNSPISANPSLMTLRMCSS